VGKLHLPEPIHVDDVEVGEDLWYYQEGDLCSTPWPAKVTAKGNDSLTLHIMAPDCKNFVVKDGVHHLSDPRSRRVETRDQGGWDRTPRNKLLRKLLEDFCDGQSVPVCGVDRVSAEGNQ
jgi:hypothetical protein